MVEGDKIKVNLITELSGVVSTNILYFDVSDANLITTIEAALLEIATAFNAALSTIRSSAAKLTCASWDNLNGNDPFTQTFFDIAGLGLGTALPAQCAVRVTRYAIDAGEIKVGGIYVAGIDEQLVNRGRINGAGEAGTIESWMVGDVILAAGPTLVHGFLINTSPPTPTNDFVFTTVARTRPRVVSLSRRQSRLCGA